MTRRVRVGHRHVCVYEVRLPSGSHLFGMCMFHLGKPACCGLLSNSFLAHQEKCYASTGSAYNGKDDRLYVEHIFVWCSLDYKKVT